MRKSLFLYSLLGIVLFAGCTNTATTTDTTTDTNEKTVTESTSIICPEGTEYWESKFENGNIKAQGCFRIGDSVMEGHWIYYFENGGKDSEGEMINDEREGLWTFYDEEGNNTVEIEGNYADDLEEGEWKYYIDGEYVCTDIFSQGALTDEGTCERDDSEVDFDESETEEIANEE